MWREGKKKSLEGEEERPEGRDEVSATQWGRAERAGGVATGGAEAGGDRARAWAASEHGVAGTEAQRGTLRWMVSSAARNSGPTRGVIGRGATANLDASNGSEEGLLREEWSPEQVSGHLRLEARAGDQPRDHLPVQSGRIREVEARCTNICAVRARAAGNATGVTTAEGDWREKE